MVDFQIYLLIYFIVLISGWILIYIDNKHNKVKNYIFEIDTYIPKQLFYYLYLFIVIVLYIIPVINIIALLLHLLFNVLDKVQAIEEYIEDRFKR